MNLPEEERPHDYPQVVCQDKAIAQLQRLEARGLAGRTVLLTGKTGTGKTTLARILARHATDQIHVDERDAKDLTPAEVADIQSHHATRPMFGGAYVVIVNEVQGIGKAALVKLLTALEATPHTLWVFTTTAENLEDLAKKHKDWSAFLGRCNRVKLNQRMDVELVAPYLRTIAQKHHLDGRDVKHYERLYKDNRSSIRECLCRIEDGAMLD